MPQLLADKIISNIPSQETLENRFLFINNEVLRTNLAIALKYITFLTSLEAELKLPGTMVYTIYKDIIIYTSSIVESCLNYTLNELIHHKKIKASCIPFEWKDDKCVELYSITKSKKIYGVIRHKKFENINNKTQFKTINEIAYKAKVINKTIFNDLETLRLKRNHIHLTSLDIADVFYDKDDVNQSFKITKIFLNRVEKILLKIQ